MNAQTQSLTLTGSAGPIEAVLDLPEADLFEAPHGTAVIAHPHPQFGGTMTNKVVQTIARACVQCGWRAVRFNFRGVGASGGHYDEGRGEVDDMLAVVAQTAPADQPLLLAELHPQTLVVHGEQDDTVPLASVMDWARPQSLPVTVVPGGEHFFHGQLPLLKALVVRHVRV